MTDIRLQGLYQKYKVFRTDNRDGPGDKHEDCQLFVLDLTHDPAAIPAIRAYIEAIKETYPILATDLKNLESVYNAAGQSDDPDLDETENIVDLAAACFPEDIQSKPAGPILHIAASGSSQPYLESELTEIEHRTLTEIVTTTITTQAGPFNQMGVEPGETENAWIADLIYSVGETLISLRAINSDQPEETPGANL